MKPYFQQGNITLYHADARDIIPHLPPVQLTLTDPPYGIDGGRGGGNRKRGKGNYVANWDDTPEYTTTVVVPIVQQCLNISERAIITPGSKCLQLYPEPDDIGCFWTPASVGFGSWGYLTFNPILYYGKDPRAGVGQWPNGTTITQSANVNWHPCPKPLNAWQWLLAKGSTNTADIILDPFVGSGTTLVAAQNLNHPAIGIEIEEAYCEQIATRLQSTTIPLPLG